MVLANTKTPRHSVEFLNDVYRSGTNLLGLAINPMWFVAVL
jgi:hypothetical protein